MPALPSRVLAEIHDRLSVEAKDGCPRDGQLFRLLSQLERALSRRPSSAKRKTARKRRAKRLETAAIRDAVFARAGGRCECGCGRWFRGVGGRATLDHFEGRARSESVETCWMLRTDCHDEKSLNQPSAQIWLQRFVEHCERHGYHAAAAKAEARLAFVETRNQLQGGKECP